MMISLGDLISLSTPDFRKSINTIQIALTSACINKNVFKELRLASNLLSNYSRLYDPDVVKYFKSPATNNDQVAAFLREISLMDVNFLATWISSACEQDVPFLELNDLHLLKCWSDQELGLEELEDWAYYSECASYIDNWSTFSVPTVTV